MSDEKPKNKVEINLQTGTIILESSDERIEKLLKLAEDQAKKLTLNKNFDGWGIR